MHRTRGSGASLTAARCAIAAGKRIQDGYYYRIGGDILCRSCLDDEYRRDVDDDE